MDENNQKVDARSANTSIQEVPVPNLRTLLDDSIHSGATASNVAASGGSGAASDDIPNVIPAIMFMTRDVDSTPGGLKSTTFAAFTKAFDNEEKDATASGYPTVDSRRLHPDAHAQNEKEAQYLQMDNQNSSITTEELERKTNFCKISQSFCTNCIWATNENENENEIQDEISTLSRQTMKTHGLIDTNNHQTIIRMSEEINQLRKNETVHQDIVKRMKRKISNLEREIDEQNDANKRLKKSQRYDTEELRKLKIQRKLLTVEVENNQNEIPE